MTWPETPKTGFLAPRPIYEPVHEIPVLIASANSKGSDESAQSLCCLHTFSMDGDEGSDQIIDL